MLTKESAAALMAGLRQIKSPLSLATFGAFFVPEPLGTCLVLLAAIWWLWRKLDYSDNADLFLELSDRNLSFYIFRAEQSGTTTSAYHGLGYAFPSEARNDRNAPQAYLEHKNIQHTVRYTELSPTWLKNFWRA